MVLVSALKRVLFLSFWCINTDKSQKRKNSAPIQASWGEANYILLATLSYRITTHATSQEPVFRTSSQYAAWQQGTRPSHLALKVVGSPGPFFQEWRLSKQLLKVQLTPVFFPFLFENVCFCLAFFFKVVLCLSLWVDSGEMKGNEGGGTRGMTSTPRPPDAPIWHLKPWKTTNEKKMKLTPLARLCSTVNTICWV